MTILCLTIAIVMFVISPFQGLAQEKQFQPGEYITEGGWGFFSIKHEQQGKLAFAILSIGGNAHTCSLEGQIHNGRATLKTGEKAKPCVVSFVPKGDDIHVTTSGWECQYFCGARAGFEGLYLKPAQGCGKVALQKTRNEFKRLYDKKAYAQARLKLESVLKDCARTLNWLEIGWIRNDLAITQYKLGDLEGCRRTLQPLAADAVKTEEELRDEYPPVDADNYIPIVDAARTNLKLCDSK